MASFPAPFDVISGGRRNPFHTYEAYRDNVPKNKKKYEADDIPKVWLFVVER